MLLLVLGIGNTLLKDDAAGILVAREVKKRVTSPGVDVVEASLGGIGLLDIMAGYDEVIIVDSIKTANGIPGTIYKLAAEELGEVSYPCGPHFLDVRTAVELGKQFGYNMPDTIEIYGVEIKDNTTFSETLSPEVEEAIPELVQWILDGIQDKKPQRS